MHANQALRVLGRAFARHQNSALGSRRLPCVAPLQLDVRVQARCWSASAKVPTTVGEVLERKKLSRAKYQIHASATLDGAITHLVQQKLSSSLVVNDDEEVLGIFTARDLLRNLAKFEDKCDGLPTSIQTIMTPIQRMVYCSPHDSVRRCRQVMSELKIRNLPILDGKAVIGIINIKDISDFTFKVEELGGKQAFLKNVAVRKGLPTGTKLVDFQLTRPADLMQMDVAVSALPHPFKCADGSIGANMRDYGGRELATDVGVSEDAYFAASVVWPTKFGPRQDILAVADGVGAWREFGVDPRTYAKTLIDNVQRYVSALSPHSLQDPLDTYRPPLKPIDIMAAAWTMTNDAETVGSATLCIATLDHEMNQLSYSNLGDCGLIVIRHIDMDVAGYMRFRDTPRQDREHDLRLAYFSQQQLKSFNLPYQLGFSNLPQHANTFETPGDADTASIPVMAGDIVVLATDGLFDNVHMEEITSIVSEWEKKWFRNVDRELTEPVRDDRESQAIMQELAESLVRRARIASLDTTRDSPFAMLAKDNDIMWGGGMPDDTTVVVARIYKAGET